jgi:N-[(2S)-2-amino-2-carboxyethyl]-L-glutamate dehydrogenase
MSTATAKTVPEFRVYSGTEVQSVLEGRREEVVAAIEAAYVAHRAGQTVNPDSYFLRFPDRPADRIIALPATLRPGAGHVATGLKWISSFPGNVDAGLARASALLILNDEETGYPVACMEAAAISATRTAVGAAIGLRELVASRPAPTTVSLIGAGVINHHLLRHLDLAGVAPERVVLFDRHRDNAAAFAAAVPVGLAAEVSIVDTLDEAVRAGDVVAFATTASAPHVDSPAAFEHHPVVLHLSLRDLAPEIVLGSANVVDDVDHCLKANTSLHLTEQQVGNRRFVDGTLPGLLCGEEPPGPDRTAIFSPFGMGILDVVVGDLVHRALRDDHAAVEGFFHDARRF